MTLHARSAAAFKNRFVSRMIEPIRNARAKYVEMRFRLWLGREIKASGSLRGRVTPPTRAIQKPISPRTTILFFPEYPLDRTVVFKLCKMLGYAMTADPDGQWDVAFKWQDTTFFDRALLGRLPSEVSIINGGCFDVSKTAVEKAMKQVFGYSAAIDPTQYSGPAVQKSDQNATHDGKIIRCPLPEASLIPGCVYQKLIDNSLFERAIYETRVPVIGWQIPLVFLKYRPIERRFGLRNSIVHMAEADDILSDSELKSIIAFSRKMGLDYGELDVLRDARDGRIYVVDANDTPYGPPKRLSPALQQVALATLAETFAGLIQESRRDNVLG